MDRDDVKSILKTTTSDAVREGAFGLPFMVIDAVQGSWQENQTFFGSDRFEVMSHKLGITPNYFVHAILYL